MVRFVCMFCRGLGQIVRVGVWSRVLTGTLEPGAKTTNGEYDGIEVERRVMNWHGAHKKHSVMEDVWFTPFS
jgi:hypothetical protein